jgi:hypothetical protein
MWRDPARRKIARVAFKSVKQTDSEDTDVFHVLTRKPAVPEMIATERFVYQVGVDGVITYVGTTEEVLKAK